MTDDDKPLKKPTRKDRVRAKKKSFKLSEKQVEMIRSQKGKMSIRKICEWYKKRHHNIHTVSPGLVHGILTGKYHKPPEEDEERVSIYDLINSDLSEEELENLDPKKVRYD
jgi:hypothetical protein